MRFEGALIKEQGVTFAIVVVKPHIIRNSFQANDAIRSFQPLFPGTPIVLMAQDGFGTPTYYGRNDLVNFMASVPMAAVPWQEFTA